MSIVFGLDTAVGSFAGLDLQPLFNAQGERLRLVKTYILRVCGKFFLQKPRRVPC